MANDESEIPLVGRLEGTGLQLLVTRTPSGDRRIEDWIASNLDLESDPSRTNHWNQLIANLPTSRRQPTRKTGDSSSAGTPTGWSRFNIAYRRGITVVRLVDRALVDRTHIQEMGCDLMDLIDVGNHRLVLNFTLVERLGSWIIGVIGNAHRRCAAGDGGKLKICGLDAQLAEIFSIVGMAGQLDLHADEAAAIDSPWPPRSTPRQLPIDILSALLVIGGIPPLRGGAPSDEAALADRLDPEPKPEHDSRLPLAPATPGFPVSLRVQIGSSDCRTVSVSKPRFLIGRDRGCQLRLGSAQVSKQHAALEQRDGRVYLRDLGSTNGTFINGRHIRDLEVDLRDGDQFQVGPVLATLHVGIPTGNRGHAASLVTEWPEPKVEELTLLTPLAEDAPCTEELPLLDDLDPALRIKFEVLEEVLVITPQLPELEDEATLEALRSKLAILFVEPLPRRVVVNLEFVNHLSRQAIALMLAHHFRLEWTGGALRICQAHARIIALLDQVRLTMLVDCYPTLDEAVLAAWSLPATSSPAQR